MIKKVLKLAAVLLVGWIIYVQFWGTTDQKALRKQMFDGVKKTGQSIGDIAKSEKGRFKDVSFKDALGKVGTSIDNLRANSKERSANFKEKVDKLSEKKKGLDNLLEKLKLKKDSEITAEEEKNVQEELKSLSELMEEIAREEEASAP